MPIPAEASAAIGSQVRRRLSRSGSASEPGTLAPAPRKIGGQGGVGRTASAGIAVGKLGELDASGASASEEGKGGEEEKSAGYEVDAKVGNKVLE